TRSRRASPMSRFFPETRNGIVCLRSLLGRASLAAVRRFVSFYQRSTRARKRQSWSQHNRTLFHFASRCRAGQRLLLAPPLDRRRYPHSLTVFCDSAPCDVDAGFTQPFHDGVVRKNILRAFGVDELLDAMAHRFGRMRLAAI